MAEGAFVPFRSKEEDHLLLAITDITDRKLAEDKLRESEKRLVPLLSAAQMSVWEWDARTNNVIWSPEFYEIAGIEESDFDGSFDGYTGRISRPSGCSHLCAKGSRPGCHRQYNVR